MHNERDEPELGGDDGDEPINWTDEDAEAVARSRRTLEPPPLPEPTGLGGEDEDDDLDAEVEQGDDWPPQTVEPEHGDDDNALPPIAHARGTAVTREPAECEAPVPPEPEDSLDEPLDLEGVIGPSVRPEPMPKPSNTNSELSATVILG